MKRTQRSPSQLSESLDKRLTAYALAASATRPGKAAEPPLTLFHYAASAAGMGLLTLAHPAQAKIVYTPANVVIGGYVPLDLNHDGKDDFSLNKGNSSYCPRTNDCYGVEWMHVSAASSQGRNRILGKTGIASVLPAGMRVGPKNQFLKADYFMGSLRWHRSSRTQAYKYYGPCWIDSGKGVKNQYLGLKFLIKGKPHYGWARLTVSVSTGSFQATLSGYAYETIANKAIVTGKTKGSEIVLMEPATLGHLARGASAISAWRWRQSEGASQ